MSTPNKVLMSESRDILKGNWTEAVKVTFVYLLIAIVVQSIPKVGPIAGFIIAGPFTLGLAIFWLSFSRKQEYKLNQIFEGFHDFWRGLKAYFLVTIFTLLWSLLLIIPGIIASISYSQTYFILAEDKTIGVNAAINKSKAMMNGNKLKFFYLGLRFIGWALLSMLTLGIGLLWLIPYMQVTMVRFYDDIKNTPETVPISEVN